jgi:hypothetical protein
MKTQSTQFTLINSTYSASNAKEVLTSLINDKIRFLNIQILSAHERFGENTAHLEARVKELVADRNRLIELLDQSAETNTEIEIVGSVEITVKAGAEIA